jgi:alkanesulfonate monooxygenase SsuD/methylene tetrahydromethanopterin reductase-like flavin-dependent oxidoreductase (luciferase family)
MGAGATRNEEFFVEMEQIRGYLKEQGRDDAGFPLSKRIYIAIDRDEQKAQERLQAGLMGQYGRVREGVGVAGTPEQCVEMLRSMRDAGLHHLLLHAVGASMQQLEILTSEVAPQL